MSKDKTELLKKLKTLSKYGVGGEKIEAEKALNKIMQKYHIKEEDIKEDDYREIKIRFKGKEEEKILYQICYKILAEKIQGANLKELKKEFIRAFTAKNLVQKVEIQE